METSADCRDPGHCGPMAQVWICALLACDHKGPASDRQEEDFQRGTDLIFRMVIKNPTWGAPRIHGELLMLGFDLSERTISRWMKRAPRNPEPAKRWLVFLRNHREAIAAMDFFTVPTMSFGVLYCFFVIGHDRRRILHINVTKHPTSLWIIQQLREAFPFGSAARFLIFDRDSKYGLEVPTAVRSLRMIPMRTSFESPWQNGVAERWVGSCQIG